MGNFQIKKVRKRSGTITNFDQGKIAFAIARAAQATGHQEKDLASQVSSEVVSLLEKNYKGKIPTVENIQDLVEEVLIKKGYADIARAYILYRQKRFEVREAKKFFGVKDDLKLSVNAIKVLKRRYLLKDEKGMVVETPKEMFERVARAVAQAEKIYGRRSVAQAEEDFYKMMVNLDFLPNSPTLMNAGTEIGQLSACYVLPVEDSIEGIFDAVKDMALIHKSGGGVGFSFSRIRPKGDVVKTTMGIASGPLSFMQVFDVATSVIRQGGRRRGANMGILRIDHPDILDFIAAKEKEGFLTNFNLSVAVTDEFINKLKNDQEYYLINPRTGKKTKKLKAKEVFNLIVTMAWRTGDPGLIFIDEINRHNPTPFLGQIESTNPCGEQPLLPFESCNLGSINLAKMVKDNQINWEKLGMIVRSSVHFLDNVIDVNQFPRKEVEEMTKGNRKIGLGVMGFAEMLIKLGIPYNSKEALKIAQKVMKFISEEARKKSIELGESRGSFPNFEKSIWRKKGYRAMRNASLTTIAPTGTISIIAGASSGIEPLFALSFIRNVMEGTRLLEVNPIFEEVAIRCGFYSEGLMMELAKKGTARGIKKIPKEIRRIFVTAFDISPEWHVKMQAVFQRYTDNAVSKTVNLPFDASPEDVRRVYLLAYDLKCKGITVYRYGSRKEQVLYIGSLLAKETGEEDHISADSEYAGGCPAIICPF